MTPCDLEMTIVQPSIGVYDAMWPWNVQRNLFYRSQGLYITYDYLLSISWLQQTRVLLVISHNQCRSGLSLHVWYL